MSEIKNFNSGNDPNRINPNDVPTEVLLRYAIKDMKSYKEYSKKLEEIIKEKDKEIESLKNSNSGTTEIPEEILMNANLQNPTPTDKEILIQLRNKVLNQRKAIAELNRKMTELNETLKGLEINPKEVLRSIKEEKSIHQLSETLVTTKLKDEIRSLNRKIFSLERQLFRRDFKSALSNNEKALIESRYDELSGKDEAVEFILEGDVNPENVIVVIFFKFNISSEDPMLEYYRSLGVDYLLIDTSFSSDWVKNSIKYSYTMDGGKSETAVSSVRKPKKTRLGYDVSINETSDPDFIEDKIKNLIFEYLKYKL